MTQWKRPAGPLAVWRVVEAHQALKDGTKKPVKISIQEIPDDEKRKQEVYDHLYTYYLTDEPLAKCTNLKDNPDAVEDYKAFWKYGLEGGLSIGCYKLDSNGKIGELVGVNVLFVVNAKTIEDFNKIKSGFKSEEFRKIWALGELGNREANVFEIYEVDKYLGSISLSVSNAFRGQKLGYHMLSLRSDIGTRYGIPVTSTIFTANQSQMQAARAGFEEKFCLDYVDHVDERGKEVFPNVGWKNCKVMTRRLP